MRTVKMDVLLAGVSVGIAGLVGWGIGCGPYPNRTNPSEYERPKEDEDTHTHGSDTGTGDTGEDGGGTQTETDSGSTTSPPEDTGSGDQTDTTGSTEPQAQVVQCSQMTPTETIEIRERAFVDGNLTVPPDSVVKFVNQEDRDHNVEYGRPSDPDRGSLFDTKIITKGESVCIHFETVGEYPYLCRVHPNKMQKTITVSEDDGGGSPESPTSVDCADRDPAATVSIVDRTYRNGSPTISAGEVVEWVNEGDEKHTVVSGDGEDDPDRGAEFDSGEFRVGESYCVEFPEGTYSYFCRERGADEMAGTVTAN